MAMDWDKVRVFYAAAEAGSFTHAGSALGLSQSAISRQVSALEADLRVPLFHRHARGLILTEQGELLYRTAREVLLKLEQTRAKLSDSREKPNGELKITANIGLGAHWLTPRLGEFLDQFPEIRVQLLLTDDELDLAMREADVALRLRQPVQGDLIQRKLFTVHFHAYATGEYLKRFGQPQSVEELDEHRLLMFGGTLPAHLLDLNWHLTSGRGSRDPRQAFFVINNLTGLMEAVEKGYGIAMLPDYLVRAGAGLQRLLTSETMPELDCYLVYAEEMKGVARVQVFRDFIVGNAYRWAF
jgi:DNA-binding transcriptional LysR family regulator